MGAVHTLLAVDTSYLYFRAFHGVPNVFTSPDGHPVNAVRGTCDSLTSLIGRHSPGRVVCAWDTGWRPSWRVALLPSYKAHRVGPDGGEQVEADLARQVPWIRRALTAVGLPVLGVEDHEADDVLASLAAQHEGPVLVASGDRDLLQLVDEHTSVLNVGRSVAKHEVLTPDDVLRRHGVPPERYVDLAVLRGDPSDGLPGVTGVGEKTAAALVDRYASLEAILAAADDPTSVLRPAVRRHLLEEADYVRRAEQVVRTVRTLEVPVPHLRDPDREAVEALTDELGLGSSLRRLADALTATEQVER